MKKISFYIPLLVLPFLLGACKNEQQPITKTVTHPQETVQEKSLNPDANYVAATFEIEGMTCAMGCAKTIEKNIAKMDGIKDIVVDFETKTAQVEYDPAMVNKELLLANVKKTGDAYEVISWNPKTIE